MKTLKFENLRTHVTAWSIFIAYEILIGYTFSGSAGSFWDNIAYFSLNITLFYFNAHIGLPNATNGKFSYLKLPALILGEIVFFVVCRYLIVLLFHYLHLPLSPPFKTYTLFIGTSVFRGIYFIGLSTGYWFALSTILNGKKIADLENAQLRNQLQNEALEKALLTSENAYLRAQINPHFLLNTLNFLYNSVSKFSEQIADSVMTLADIMRYALTNAGEDGKVMLDAEIEQISNFIKLNQARFNQRLNINLLIEGDAEGLRIIPLILITLAENVFKYGDLLNDCNPAMIAINIDGNNLTFTTQNLKKKRVNEQSHGIGINNVKSRLAMYHQYELVIEDNERDYKSILKIKL